jgi:hypothetical protein
MDMKLSPINDTERPRLPQESRGFDSGKETESADIQKTKLELQQIIERNTDPDLVTIARKKLELLEQGTNVVDPSIVNAAKTEVSDKFNPDSAAKILSDALNNKIDLTAVTQPGAGFSEANMLIEMRTKQMAEEAKKRAEQSRN